MSELELHRSTEPPPVNNPRDALDFDLLVLSHLRWDLVYQRPQHLLSRGARARRVFFLEEDVRDAGSPRLEFSRRDCGVTVAVPHLPRGLDARQTTMALRWLLDEFLRTHECRQYVLWYYTPMALAFTRHLHPAAVVYDCMDELAAFAGAPAAMKERERELLTRADLVFTGGRSLHEAKAQLRPNAHLFPSSIDVGHFRRARVGRPDPADQAGVGAPRLGYFGVIDERIDLDLLAGIADLRPDFNLVLLGPVAKIDPGKLPQRANIHYLGPKPYLELPSYLAGWDVALIPFARNASTRFVSPTKTPEYLAAGRPVVSTPIRDVVEPYGVQGLVAIAETPEEFVVAVESALHSGRRHAWLREVDAFLQHSSWDHTWNQMECLIHSTVLRNTTRETSTAVQPAPTRQ